MRTLSIKLVSTLLLLSGLMTASAQTTVVTYQGRVTSHGTNFSGNGQFKFALGTVTNTAATATATANLTGPFVTSVTVTFGGDGYDTAPAVTFSGGGGSGAAAHAVLTGNSVTSVIVDNTGSGFSSPPAVTIAPPPDSESFTTLWSNDNTSVDGQEPTSAVAVTVDSGLFTVRLGDATLANMTNFPAGLFQQPDLHLSLWFNDGVSGFDLLLPTQPLSAAPYAMTAADLSGTLAASRLSGTISSNNIGAGSISGTMLASGSVTASKLAQEVLDLLIPSGTVVAYGGSVAPAGWVICNGSVQNASDTAFSALFAVIGKTYGIGDGTSTSFNLPDLRGRAVIGAGQGTGLSNRTLASTLGTETITQVPNHVHVVSLTTGSAGAHTHNLDGWSSSGGSTRFIDTAVAATTSTYQTSSSGAHTHTVNGNTANNTSGVASVNNLQPTIVLNCIIKL